MPNLYIRGNPVNLAVVYKSAKILVDTLETVDRRCMAADGPVSKTEEEWTLEEVDAVREAMKQIALQATRKPRRKVR